MNLRTGLVLALVAAAVSVGVGQWRGKSAASSAAFPEQETAVQPRLRMTNQDALPMSIIVEGVRKIGWKLPNPKAGIYIWFEVPQKGMSSMDFASKVLEGAGVILLPGSGFGQAAEGFLRIALTITEDRLHEAVKRLAALKL